MRIAINYLSLLLLAIMFFVSCQTMKETLTEPQKDLNGTYKIVKITRNTVDITQYVDSSGFRLTLASDNTYTLQSNNIPFIVNTNGKFSIDDPQYPYNLSFTPTDSTKAFVGSIGTPVLKGERNLEVTFSPGCRANSYVYTFEKLQ